MYLDIFRSFQNPSDAGIFIVICCIVILLILVIRKVTER